jgi:RNA ligase
MTYIGLRQNLPFPILVNDILMRQAVAHKEEIRFMDQDNGTVVCSYIISCDGTFDEMYSREARGVVFDKNGRVIARPLHKFFNLNQIPETQFAALDWSKVTRIMDKRDGSMIHTVKAVDGVTSITTGANFTFKSKKSFESDVAKQARAHVLSLDTVAQHGMMLFCEWCVDHDKTAIFEWTSPTARIVLAYPQDELKLLHIRDNVTGEYMNRAALEDLCAKYEIGIVDDRDDLLVTLKTEADFWKFHLETENIEGIIVQFIDGSMVKVKTKWYCDRHGVMTNLRERDIAVMVLNESLDDVKSTLAGEDCDLTEINEIEARVVRDVNEIRTEVDRVLNECAASRKIHRGEAAIDHHDRKAMALKFSQEGTNPHPYFKLIMLKFSGKEPDYNEFYEKQFLKERFGLRQLNLLQSVAEEE